MGDADFEDAVTSRRPLAVPFMDVLVNGEVMDRTRLCAQIEES
jgi:hypothetical protein